jgi:histidyl-tRNA synthetase
VVISGENERKKGTVTVKDLAEHSQKEMTVKQAVKELSK